MGLKNKVSVIRCKRADDVLVVPPTPGCERIAEDLQAGVKCGHGHLIIIGNPKFFARDTLQKMPDEIGKHAAAAYNLYPVAKILVDTLAQQLGVAVDAAMVSDVLGHGRLLDVIHAAQEKMTNQPKLGLLGPDGKPIQ